MIVHRSLADQRGFLCVGSGAPSLLPILHYSREGDEQLDLRAILTQHTGTMSDTVERQFGDLKIVIDRGTCIATDNCIVVAPEVFELDDDQICRFRQDTGNVDRDKLIEACRVCPVDALSVIDASGKQLVP